MFPTFRGHCSLMADTGNLAVINSIRYIRSDLCHVMSCHVMSCHVMFVVVLFCCFVVFLFCVCGFFWGGGATALKLDFVTSFYMLSRDMVHFSG